MIGKLKNREDQPGRDKLLLSREDQNPALPPNWERQTYEAG